MMTKISSTKASHSVIPAGVYANRNAFRRTGESDLQDVGNVARGQEVRSDRYPVEDVFLLDPDFHRDDGGGWVPARVYTRQGAGMTNWKCSGLIQNHLNFEIGSTHTVPILVISHILWIIFSGITLLFLLLAPAAFAGDLGRLFTTPQERAALEKLRNQKPVQKVEPEIVIEEPGTEPAEEKPEIGGITVHGLVYRNGGKSTAWVNSGNTYEGDLGNQYLQIDAGNIKPEDVVIEIPITDTTLSLKAGETFNPEAEEPGEPDYNHQ